MKKFPKETHASNTAVVAEDLGNLHLQHTFTNLTT